MTDAIETGTPFQHTETIQPAPRPHHLAHPPPERQCTAPSRAQNGERCPNWAIKGGTVCRYHGGSAPQVRAKAQERLEAAALPAVSVLRRAVDRKRQPDGVGIAAAKEVLNRVLGVPGQTIALTGADGGPLRVIHQYAQIADTEALSLPDGEVIDAETVPAGEPQATAAAPAGRRFGF